MMYASTFLSHSSVDKPLVEAVARELGRRGIIAWLDKNELQVGTSLSAALTEAIQRQVTVTIFLSPAALASPWVEDELAVALQQEDQLSNDKLIMPIYLGDPLQLVSSHPLLRSRWLHPDGDRVNRLGIVPHKKPCEKPCRFNGSGGKQGCPVCGAIPPWRSAPIPTAVARQHQGAFTKEHSLVNGAQAVRVQQCRDPTCTKTWRFALQIGE